MQDAYHLFLDLGDGSAGPGHVTTGEDHMSSSIREVQSRPKPCRDRMSV